MAAPTGNWQKELENSLKSEHSTHKIADLMRLRSEEDKLRFIHEQHIISSIPWITAYFDNCQSLHSKSSTTASSARRNGNTHFQKRKYSQAAQLYSQAIVESPLDSDELPLAYGNRSAVLFHLSQFKECLTDIQEAFCHGFPRPLQYKLYIRKLHCLMKIIGWTDIATVIKDALEAVKEADADLKKKDLYSFEILNRDNLRKEIQDVEAEVKNSIMVSQTEPDQSPVPKVSYGYSPVVVQASVATSLQYNSIQGRYLTASRDIKAGDTLIVERPFAAVLLPEHYPTHCHHCFVKLTYRFPCRRCTQVLYCSPACASDSWSTYHSIECPYLQLLHSVGIAHLSLRVVLVAGLSFLNEFKGQLDQSVDSPTIPGLDSNGQYCRNYRAVYDLMTHVDDMDKDDLFQYTVTADLLLAILQHSGWFDTGSTVNTDSCKVQPGKDNSRKEETDSQTEKLVDNIDSLNLSKCARTDIHSDSDRSRNQISDGTFIENVNLTGTTNDIENNIDNADIKNGESGNSHIENSIDTSKNTRTDRKQHETDNKGRTSDISLPVDPNTASDISIGDTHAKMKSPITQTSGYEMEMYIGGLLLRHILQLVCNAHAITELQCTEAAVVGSRVEEMSEVRVATAIYPTASLMNHACQPTILSSFHRDTLVVRAVRDVKKGEEIFNSYGIHHKRMAYRERQRCLKEQYFFTCHCPPCVDGERADSLLFSYKCSACPGPLIRTQSGEYCCSECQNKTTHVDSAKADHATQLFQQGLMLLQQNKIKDALQVMKRCCRLRTDVLYKHNKDLSETQDCVARCLATLGQFREAADYLKASVGTVKMIYGGTSIEAANELQKLSEILISAQEWRDALTVTQEAVSVFTVHYGRQNDTVKELVSAREHLKEIVGSSG